MMPPVVRTFKSWETANSAAMSAVELILGDFWSIVSSRVVERGRHSIGAHRLLGDSKSIFPLE